MSAETCPYCLGAGTVTNWIYKPRKNCFVLPVDRPRRDCPMCGGTKVVLDYENNAVIPPSRALVTPHDD